MSVIILAVILIVFDESSAPTSIPNPEIEIFLAGNPESLVAFRSVLGQFEAEAGHGNEIILITEVDDYDALRERAESYGTSMGAIIDDVLEEGTTFFTQHANQLRDEIALDELRLTIRYVGDGDDITSASFDSE